MTANSERPPSPDADVHAPETDGVKTIYREGTRIRGTLGGGYSDRVPDREIAGHAYDLTNTDEERAFALATLAIRAYERAVAEEYRR